jgi:hypothetical protein
MRISDMTRNPPIQQNKRNWIDSPFSQLDRRRETVAGRSRFLPLANYYVIMAGYSEKADLSSRVSRKTENVLIAKCIGGIGQERVDLSNSHQGLMVSSINRPVNSRLPGERKAGG